MCWSSWAWLDIDRIDEDMVRLNEQLRRAGDPARIRYTYLEHDPYLEGYWIVWATLEMPPPDDPDEPDCWLHETHQKYRQILEDFYADEYRIFTMHEFRTAEELAEPGSARGRPVPEPA